MNAQLDFVRNDAAETCDLPDIALDGTIRIEALDSAVNVGDLPRTIPLEGDIVLRKFFNDFPGFSC